VTPDSDGFGAHGAEANRFAHTVACSPPEEGYPQRNRRGTGPRRGRGDADGEGGDDFIVSEPLGRCNDFLRLRFMVRRKPTNLLKFLPSR
jgi:hypothetical protein